MEERFDPARASLWQAKREEYWKHHDPVPMSEQHVIIVESTMEVYGMTRECKSGTWATDPAAAVEAHIFGEISQRHDVIINLEKRYYRRLDEPIAEYNIRARYARPDEIMEYETMFSIYELDKEIYGNLSDFD